MLEAGKTYKDNRGKLVYVVGKIRDYSESKSWMWSVAGDWYSESTGAFISCRRVCKDEQKSYYDNYRYEQFEIDVDAHRSIANHTHVNEGDIDA